MWKRDKKRESPAASAAGLSRYSYINKYTYGLCSLTTAGVVTDATTNMYLPIVFSYDLLLYGGKCRECFSTCKRFPLFFLIPRRFFCISFLCVLIPQVPSGSPLFCSYSVPAPSVLGIGTVYVRSRHGINRRPTGMRRGNNAAHLPLPDTQHLPTKRQPYPAAWKKQMGTP